MPTMSSNVWIAYRRPNPQASLRLFCFPFAGGAASAFCQWSYDLPQVEVCPIQLPGRENRLREAPFSHIEPLLEALVSAMRPYLDRPYAFFGHSMGATIGFELARLLRMQNDPGPFHLFVSGNRAPQIPAPNPPIHHLPDEEFIEGLRRFNGTPEQVFRDDELLQLFLPILRADLTLYETYVYTADEPLDCPISAFGGSEDKIVSRDDLAAWRHQTHGAFTLRMFIGDHFFLRSAQTHLLRAMSQDVTRILGCVDERASL